MKIILTADIHLGYQNKLPDILFALKAIRHHMKVNNITHCFILGDLFDNRQATAIDVMSESYRFFKETKSDYHQKWMVFPGNHDMFLKNSWAVNSIKAYGEVLSIIEDVALIELYGRRFHIVPFVHYEDVYMKIIDNIAKTAEKDDVLLTHIGVNGAELNKCFQLKNWSVVNFENFPHQVFTGHFHCHQTVGDNVTYPGSPIPFRFDEGVVDHGFLEYETDDSSFKLIKTFDVLKDFDEYPVSGHPPDFITITDELIDDVGDSLIAGNNIRVSLDREYTSDERMQLRLKLSDMDARSVSWMKLKESEVSLSKIDADGVSITKPGDLLKTWLSIDKPDHIDESYLLQLNKEIIEAAGRQSNDSED